MPYIDSRDRQDYDESIDAILAVLKTTGIQPGHLNYVVTRLAIEYASMAGDNYAAFQEAAGALEMAKLEFYRRAIAPYEDKKIKLNGDVYK
jgi:hypothetical protein